MNEKLKTQSRCQFFDLRSRQRIATPLVTERCGDWPLFQQCDTEERAVAEILWGS